ncbi:transcription factor UPBEAT1 [Populus alba x Populus x berolinensis]|nr:transcription factor UPBEAT1 [Populus alba x Populus x berolinensis]
MGVSAGERPLLVSLKAMVQGNEETTDHMSLKGMVVEAQTKRRCSLRRQKNGRRHARSKRPGRILMKRRARAEGSTMRAGYGIERRVRTLKKLVPDSESMGLDGLFRETADYILSLQMRVRVMQIMVKVLTGSDDEY